MATNSSSGMPRSRGHYISRAAVADGKTLLEQWVKALRIGKSAGTENPTTTLPVGAARDC